MAPYIVLILIPTLFAFVAIDRTSKVTRIRLGSPQNDFIKQHNLTLPVFFIILFLLLALRDETIGRDLHNYKYYFEKYPQQELEYVDLFRGELLYRLLNWIVGQITDEYQIFLMVVAALMLLPIAWLYCEDRRNSYLKMLVFVNMSTFVMLFSGLRQMLALSCGIVAYDFVRKKKPVLFLLTVVVALGFHHSAFILLVMYPLYHARFKKNHLWIIVPLLAIVLVFNSQIFSAANVLYASLNEKYEIVAGSTGAYMSLVLFALFAIFAYIVPDESKMDAELFGLRNFLLAAVFFQCFAPVHALAMRMNYYFIIFIPIALAKLIEIPRAGMERVAKLALIVISLFFTCYFLDTLYDAYRTGVSALDTMPYKPFWG